MSIDKRFMVEDVEDSINKILEYCNPKATYECGPFEREFYDDLTDKLCDLLNDDRFDHFE